MFMPLIRKALALGLEAATVSIVAPWVGEKVLYRLAEEGGRLKGELLHGRMGLEVARWRGGR